MSDFKAPEGWERVTTARPFRSGEPRMVEYDAAGEVVCIWVRQVPVLPLPTAPSTTIEITSTTDPAYDLTAWFLTPNDEWSPVGEYAASLKAGFRPGVITSWRALSEPRAVTAKAVLREITHRLNGPAGYDKSIAQILVEVEDEFGVTDD